MNSEHDPVQAAEAADARRRREAERRRARRARAGRPLRRRRRAFAAGLLAALALGLVLIAVSSGGGTHRATPTSPAAVARLRAQSGHRVAHAVPRPRARAPSASPSPGSLPQTDAYPSARNARFKAQMATLWTGIVHNSLATALPAFFPKAAYVQLKAIGGSASDWSNRLVGDYALDIAAAHALLGQDAGAAELLGVRVPASYGHWVPPGTCYNSIGYYELPNARVVYRENGSVRSFGIASMISWRGVWYVVHLGAILRSSESGVVDEPASGPGISSYSGTC